MVARHVIQLQRHPNGPRLFVAHQRIHHGATGCVLAAGGLRKHRAILLAALALIAHDRRDWRIWFRRESTLDSERSAL